MTKSERATSLVISLSNDFTLISQAPRSRGSPSSSPASAPQLRSCSPEWRRSAPPSAAARALGAMRFCPASAGTGGALLDTPPCATHVALAGCTLAVAVACCVCCFLSRPAGGGGARRGGAAPTLVETLRRSRQQRKSDDGLVCALLATLGAGVHGAALAHELLAVHDAGVPAAGYAVLTDALLCAAWCAFLLCAASGGSGGAVGAAGYAFAALAYGWLLREDVRLAADRAIAGGPTFAAWRLVATTMGLGAALAAAAKLLRSARRAAAGKRSAAELTQPLLGEDEEENKAAPKLADMEGAQQWWHMLVASWTLIWPDTLAMKLRVLVCLAILVFGRVSNVLFPLLYRAMINRYSDVLEEVAEGEHVSTWGAFYPPALWYCVLWFLSGSGSGFLQSMRSYLWILVGQDTYRRTYIAVFGHLFDLSLDFHLRRKSGEIIRMTSRGISASQSVLSAILFYIIPTIVDCAIACVFFAMALDPWLALLIFVTIGSYVPLTIAITEWRVKFRREMNKADNRTTQRFTDALLNYETVKFFNSEQHEEEKLREEVTKYQEVEWKSQSSLQALNTAQSVVIIIGLVVGLVLVCKRIARGQIGVGDAVLFISYMQQLYAPLNYFGTYYRVLQQNMIDLENLFQVFEEHPDVDDLPDARTLSLSSVRGELEVDDVSFAYQPRGGSAEGAPRVQVLRNVSFKVPAGTTTALVGATGSGKSTLLRLLFRSYDIPSGCVRLDGVDIATLTQDSLRHAIGVVPQDCVLFNDTLQHNLRYGRLDASDEEVLAAAKAAALDSHVQERFPQKYETVVGERGLRLSGGEKQRVAIGRAILKNAPILLLDEATSSLDSITERQVQESIAALSGTGRTTVVVAHRLSTIAGADQIIFLENGRVAEVGTHAELIQKGGKFAAMWERQLAGEGSSADLKALAENSE